MAVRKRYYHRNAMPLGVLVEDNYVVLRMEADEAHEMGLFMRDCFPSGDGAQDDADLLIAAAERIDPTLAGRSTWRHADGSVREDHMDAREGDYYGPPPLGGTDG